MSIKVSINGFGRIGRNVFRIINETDGIEVVGINDLTDSKTLCHLLKYDSIHGPFKGDVCYDEHHIIVNGKSIPISAIRDPKNCPWKALSVDVVIESTGIFASGRSDRGGYLDHIDAGAKKVILTVPAKDEIQTIVLGVNDDAISPDIHAYSNASCTTNCLAPLAKVLHEEYGIVKGFMTTVHAYTNDQQILDLPHSDLRRARAAACSIIPTTTGAARAVALVLPDLKGKLDGQAMRVPVPDGSVVDLVCELERQPSSVEALNRTFQLAAEGPMKGVLSYTEDPIVSCDIVGNPHSSIFDSLSSMMNGNLVKLVSWYDNEYGYSSRVVDLIGKIWSVT